MDELEKEVMLLEKELSAEIEETSEIAHEIKLEIANRQ